MNGSGQSDRFVVPANPPNKAAAAEAGEERERTKGNTAGETRPGRSAGPGVSSELDRVRQVAQKDKEARFTALLHHVSLERLVMAYRDLRPKAAPGGPVRIRHWPGELLTVTTHRCVRGSGLGRVGPRVSGSGDRGKLCLGLVDDQT
jgi:hypothetical protein